MLHRTHHDKHDKPYRCVEAALETGAGFGAPDGLRSHVRRCHPASIAIPPPTRNNKRKSEIEALPTSLNADEITNNGFKELSASEPGSKRSKPVILDEDVHEDQLLQSEGLTWKKKYEDSQLQLEQVKMEIEQLWHVSTLHH